jgi:hypothetical protein
VKRASQTLVYKQEMWRHLSDYKVSALGVKPNGIWRKKHPEYAHILPFGYQHLNILEPYRDEFWKFFRGKKISLHSGFRHLSSSQAMCFNLFFPFLAEDKKHLQLLRQIFTTNSVIEDAVFEDVLDATEGTSFDFWFKTAESRKLFELKLTESGFGKAKADDAHISKFKTVYSRALKGKFDPSCCSCDVFLKHYQLMRNVWNLDIGTGDTLVCIVPKANSCLAKEIEFLKNCLSERYRQRVSSRYLEDLATALEEIIPADADRMKDHFRLFREKYLPPDSCGVI